MSVFWDVVLANGKKLAMMARESSPSSLFSKDPSGKFVCVSSYVGRFFFQPGTNSTCLCVCCLSTGPRRTEVSATVDPVS